MSFEQWIKYVDNILIKHIGMSHEGMKDFDSIGSFKQGDSPAEGAIACLEEQDDPDLNYFITMIEKEHGL